ncbi:hypothetical protein K0M31_005037 [Melipona bicolor]|uniref:Uncharacterized protein n=1 Tax=Melipona bicolor TaxID=60889 RepID=A0AA40KN51_9HYME|nr:hypothetical protein K0M31_005037 [Melipona bicolor]
MIFSCFSHLANSQRRRLQMTKGKRHKSQYLVAYTWRSQRSHPASDANTHVNAPGIHSYECARQIPIVQQRIPGGATLIVHAGTGKHAGTPLDKAWGSGSKLISLGRKTRGTPGEAGRFPRWGKLLATEIHTRIVESLVELARFDPCAFSVPLARDLSRAIIFAGSPLRVGGGGRLLRNIMGRMAEEHGRGFGTGRLLTVQVARGFRISNWTPIDFEWPPDIPV